MFMCMHRCFNHSPLYFLRPCLTLGSGIHKLHSTDGPASSRNPAFSTSPALGLQAHTVVPRFLCGCWGPKLVSLCLCSKLHCISGRWLLLSALTVSTPLGSGLPPSPVYCRYWSFPPVPLYAPHLAARWPLAGTHCLSWHRYQHLKSSFVKVQLSHQAFSLGHGTGLQKGMWASWGQESVWL